MHIIIIAAISPERVIGAAGGIPWHYRQDLRFVKRTTMGHPCVMGRKTYESFPRRPLPGRENIVLTRDPDYQVPDEVVVCADFEAARRHCEDSGVHKMFVLGGARVYNEALGQSDEMLITHVPDQIEGDTFFPAWDEEEWEMASERVEDPLRFVTYRRRAGRTF